LFASELRANESHLEDVVQTLMPDTPGCVLPGVRESRADHYYKARGIFERIQLVSIARVANSPTGEQFSTMYP